MKITACLKKAKDLTWSLRHNPNCPSPYEVRMCGRKAGRINYDQGDLIGYGKTLAEALENVLAKREAAYAVPLSRG
jgi:hypothetical protein